MKSHLSVKDLYQMIENLQEKNIQLQKENLTLSYSLASLSEMLEDSIGMQELEEEAFEFAEGMKKAELREEYEFFRILNSEENSFLQFLIKKGEER